MSVYRRGRNRQQAIIHCLIRMQKTSVMIDVSCMAQHRLQPAILAAAATRLYTSIQQEISSDTEPNTSTATDRPLLTAIHRHQQRPCPRWSAACRRGHRLSSSTRIYDSIRLQDAGRCRCFTLAI